MVGPGVATSIPVGNAIVEGDLVLPLGAGSVVLVAHGSGSSRRSHRNQYVASVLRQEGFGTLLLDLLTPEEQAEDQVDGQLRFDVTLLAQRVIGATDWLKRQALSIIPNAGHVFDEPVALEDAARRTVAWFRRWLGDLPPPP